MENAQDRLNVILRENEGQNRHTQNIDSRLIHNKRD